MQNARMHLHRTCTHLNVLVRSVYERPDSGLCVKLRIMKGCHRGTRHATHTRTFTAPMAQHMRFPSEALSIGWKTWTYDQVIIAFIVSGSWSTEDFSEASVLWSR